jgi:hypothetical protein
MRLALLSLLLAVGGAPEELAHLEGEGAAKATAGVSIEATGAEIR